MTLPLTGVKIVDLSTLLPGPAASLILAEAGAEVVKVERPGGDDMRRLGPGKPGRDSAYFTLLNRGKGSVELDLKSDAGRSGLRELLEDADVLIEQFRPGVMARLGFGFDDVKESHPGLIYCSITGYGQTGPDAQLAGHDINYLARTGLSSMVGGAAEEPAYPPTPIADLAAGTYPAVMNILLALLQRSITGSGSHLDIAMADNLFPLAYWGLGIVEETGGDPRPHGELMNGGSPRSRYYRTADGRFLSVCALEDRFWGTLCDIAGLGGEERDDANDPEGVAARLAMRFEAKTANEWEREFEGVDVCCEVVRTLTEALEDPHFQSRGLFDRQVAGSAGTMTALPVPVADSLRRDEIMLRAPGLRDGEAVEH
ncbi:MAG: CaiB/BaiF CoA transferase family protein [Solirubrobacterales bacterium]